jgi:hypothetical protein
VQNLSWKGTAMDSLIRTRPKPPVRALHLGLGNFFRAHQAWYTQHAGDGDQWGIAAFTGLTGQVADALSAQDCLYTLDVRSPDGDCPGATWPTPGMCGALGRGMWLTPNATGCR